MKKLILIALILSGLSNAQTGGDFALEKSTIAAGGGQSNGGDFALEKSTIAAGGGQSNGGDFVVSGTIGQHDANTASTGGDFALSGGFWVAKATVNQPELIFTNGFEN